MVSVVRFGEGEYFSAIQKVLSSGFCQLCQFRQFIWRGGIFFHAKDLGAIMIVEEVHRRPARRTP